MQGGPLNENQVRHGDYGDLGTFAGARIGAGRKIDPAWARNPGFHRQCSDAHDARPPRGSGLLDRNRRVPEPRDDDTGSPERRSRPHRNQRWDGLLGDRRRVRGQGLHRDGHVGLPDGGKGGPHDMRVA